MSFLGTPKISHTDLTKMDGNQISIIPFFGEDVICKFNDYTRRSKLYSIKNLKKIGTYSEQIIGCWKYLNTGYCILYKTKVEYIISMYVNKDRIDEIEPDINNDYKNMNKKELRRIYHSKAESYVNIYRDCTYESSSDSEYNSEKSYSEAEESESEGEVLSKVQKEKEINYNLIKEESQTENFESEFDFDEKSDSLEQKRHHKKQKTYKNDIINEKHIDSIVKKCFSIYGPSHYQHYKSFGFEELIIAYRDKSNILNIFFRKENELYSFKIYNLYEINYTISRLYESEFLFFDNKIRMGMKMNILKTVYNSRLLIFDKYSNQMHCFHNTKKYKRIRINKNSRKSHREQSLIHDHHKGKMELFYVNSRTDNTIHMNYYDYDYTRGFGVRMTIYYNYIFLINNTDPIIYVINKYSLKIEYKLENVIQINPNYATNYISHYIQDIVMITKNQIYLLYHVCYISDFNEDKSILLHLNFSGLQYNNLTTESKRLEIILSKIELRCSWKIVRLLLLAHRKQQPEDCHIKTLPIELIKYIIMLLDYNMFNN
jgi:hypothetical protein